MPQSSMHDELISLVESLPAGGSGHRTIGRLPRRTIVRRARAVADGTIVILAHAVAVLIYLPNNAIEISRPGKFSIIAVLTAATLAALYSPGQRHALLPPVRALTLQAIVRASGLTLLSWVLVGGILSFALPLDPALVDLVLIVVGLAVGSFFFSMPADSLTVQTGDTLWSIASSLPGAPSVDAAVADLRDLNGLTTDFLQSGQILHLPSY